VLAYASDESIQLYRTTHWGARATRSFRGFGPHRCPDELVSLGVFVDLELADGTVWRPEWWDFLETVWLCFDARPRRSLYLVGRSPIEVGPLPSGRVAAVSYRADKNDGPHTYRHEFEGVCPYFDAARGRPVFQRRGSHYDVDWRGIVG
jgi:hypothetical protein